MRFGDPAVDEAVADLDAETWARGGMLWSVGQPDERAAYRTTGSTTFLCASIASVSVEVDVASDLSLSLGTAAPVAARNGRLGEPGRLTTPRRLCSHQLFVDVADYEEH